MSLSMDQLMPLTEASQLFDKVEEELRRSGKTAIADDLLKLQQDAGIELEKAFGIYDPAAGEQTAKLDAAYKEVTLTRVSSILQDAHSALGAGGLKEELGRLKNVLVPETAPAPVAVNRKRPRL